MLKLLGIVLPCLVVTGLVWLPWRDGDGEPWSVALL